MHVNVDLEKQLLDSVDELYEVFSLYPLKSNFADRCSPLGDRQELATRLEQYPPRQTPLEDLALYSFKATHTMGNEVDFKHFLPRILEFVAKDPKWFEFAVNGIPKLQKLNWQTWPKRERAALQHFLDTIWLCVISEFPWRGHTAIDFLIYTDFWRVLGINYLLDVWISIKSESCIQHLASAVQNVFTGHKEKSPIASELRSWLLSDIVHQKLTRAFFKGENKVFSKEISHAIELLDFYRSTPAQ